MVLAIWQFAHEVVVGEAGMRRDPESLALPEFVRWPTFPFEGDLRVKPLDPPVAEEPARQGEGGENCAKCQADDSEYIWVDERWRVRSLSRPSGLPVVVVLETRHHYDLGDLSNMLAAELGVLTVRLERAIRSIDGVARVHVNRWGDGSEHLHVFFLARPKGMLQLRGTFLSMWDDILPPIPERQWRENLAFIAAWLADYSGKAIAEPPPLEWDELGSADSEDDASTDTGSASRSDAASSATGGVGTTGMETAGVETVSVETVGAQISNEETANPETASSETPGVQTVSTGPTGTRAASTLPARPRVVRVKPAGSVAAASGISVEERGPSDRLADGSATDHAPVTSTSSDGDPLPPVEPVRPSPLVSRYGPSPARGVASPGRPTPTGDHSLLSERFQGPRTRLQRIRPPRPGPERSPDTP